MKPGPRDSLHHSATTPCFSSSTELNSRSLYMPGWRIP